MTKRRPMTARRLHTGDFPSLDAIAEMGYGELVETWCLIHDRRAAVPPGTNPGGTWSPRAMTRRLEKLATDDPSLVDTVAEALRHKFGAPVQPGDLASAERDLALAAVRASQVCVVDGIAKVGPFRNVKLPAMSAPLAGRDRRRQEPPLP